MKKIPDGHVYVGHGFGVPPGFWNLASLVDESRHVSTYELDEQNCRVMSGRRPTPAYLGYTVP